MYDVPGRERKARTMVAVLQDCLEAPLKSMSLLNVGGSAGIIDNVLADHFASVVGIDIDVRAVEHARQNYGKPNLSFHVCDALALGFADHAFDVVICSQVYEHVPDPEKMMAEIFRVLRPGGVCYFAANNRLMWNEPHYNLPLLAVMPGTLADVYVRLAGRAPYYHERHYTYWGLRRLVRRFVIRDYTLLIISAPQRYHADYMIRPGTVQALIARFLAAYLYWLIPGYIWVLEKPR